MKKLFALILALSMLLTMGVASAEDAKTTVVFWNSWTGGDGDALQALVTKFNESQDEVYIDDPFHFLWRYAADQPAHQGSRGSDPAQLQRHEQVQQLPAAHHGHLGKHHPEGRRFLRCLSEHGEVR